MSGLSYKAGELAARHFVATDGEGPSNRDCVLRAFVLVAAYFALGRAHNEAARGDDNHLRAIGTVAKHGARSQRLCNREGTHRVTEKKAKKHPSLHRCILPVHGRYPDTKPRVENPGRSGRSAPGCGPGPYWLSNAGRAAGWRQLLLRTH